MKNESIQKDKVWISVKIKLAGRLHYINIKKQDNISDYVNQFILQHQLPQQIYDILINKINEQIINKKKQKYTKDYQKTQKQSEKFQSIFNTEKLIIKQSNQKNNSFTFNRNTNNKSNQNINNNYYKNIQKLNFHDQYKDQSKLKDQRSTGRISYKSYNIFNQSSIKENLLIEQCDMKQIQYIDKQNKSIQQRYQQWHKLIKNRQSLITNAKKNKETNENEQKKIQLKKFNNDQMYRKGKQFLKMKQKRLQQALSKEKPNQKLQNKNIFQQLHNKSLHKRVNRCLKSQQFSYTPKINKDQYYQKKNKEINLQDQILKQLKSQGKLYLHKKSLSVSPYKKYK